MVLATFCWGSSWVVARGLYQVMPPVAMSFWRWAIAFLFILPFSWRFLRQDAPTLRENWKLLAFLGVIGTTGFSTLGYWGVNYTTAMNAALINGAMPALVIGMSAFIDRAWPSRRVAAGLVFAMCGTVFMVAKGSWAAISALQFNQGDVLVLAAMAGWGVYTCALRWRPPKLHPLSFFAFTAGCGVLSTVPLFAWENLTNPIVIPLNAMVVGGTLYVALACSVLAYTCWNAAVAVVGSQTAVLYNNLASIFGVLMAMLVLGEMPHAYHFIGALLVFAGVALVSRR